MAERMVIVELVGAPIRHVATYAKKMYGIPYNNLNIRLGRCAIKADE